MSIRSAVSEPWRRRCPNGHAGVQYLSRGSPQYRCQSCGWVGDELVDWKHESRDQGEEQTEPEVFRGGFDGSELRAWRHRNGIRQTELAAWIDVHPDTLGSWERGGYGPNLVNQLKLREAIQRASKILNGGRHAH